MDNKTFTGVVDTMVRRLKGVTEKDIKRIAKYHNVRLELKEALAAHEGWKNCE